MSSGFTWRTVPLDREIEKKVAEVRTALKEKLISLELVDV